MMTMTGEIDPQNPKHIDLLQALEKANVLEIHNGKVVINFHDGLVQSIIVEERRYQHMSPRKGFTPPI